MDSSGSTGYIFCAHCNELVSQSTYRRHLSTSRTTRQPERRLDPSSDSDTDTSGDESIQSGNYIT